MANNERLREASRRAPALTLEDLKEALEYWPETGEFIIFPKRGTAGSITRGSLSPKGAFVIRLGYRLYYAHRLAWFYVHGEWPRGNIDHKDGDPTNNRLSNLRLCNQSQNGANSRKQENTTSRRKGVCWHKAAQKWVAQITVKGERIYLGIFDNENDAAHAYAAAAQLHFGEFARAA